MESRFRVMAGLIALPLVALLSAGCQGVVDEAVGGPGGPNPGVDPLNPDPDRPQPVLSCQEYEETPIFTAAAKVKNILTGLPLTEDELASLTADETQLGSFIDVWLDTPEADLKLQAFFATAFQQEGYEEQDIADLWDFGTFQSGNLDDGTRSDDVLLDSFSESFARTAMEHFKANRPFNELMTTRSYMMTTAQMVALAFGDERLIDDRGRNSYRTLTERIPQIEYSRNEMIPAAQTLDPNHANFMRFAVPDDRAFCGADTLVPNLGNGDQPVYAFRAIFGFFNRTDRDGCDTETYRQHPLLLESDFEDWRMVTVRAPADGEDATQFYELDAIRNGAELVVNVPRVGFFTTPSFFAAWPTNVDNQARVTANQTLIVALSESFDDETTAVPAFDDSLDDDHADPTTTCWGCHVNLDPMRQFFRRSFNYYYHSQTDEELLMERPAFAFESMEGEGEDIFDFAEILAAHPAIANGWTQKLCFYANSAACPEEDPEFSRVRDAWANDGMNFRTAIRELFSSPLVTGTSCIENGTGDIAGISRGRHFCSSLSNRLGIRDICGRDILRRGERTRLQQDNEPLSRVAPDDSFSRGGESPVTISDTNMFIQGASEAICMRIANEVVDDEEGSRYNPNDVETAINSMVTDLVGLPSNDPRHD
ncbi:MAG: hypothetical protein AAGF12_27545, partial [Myxococcota bacterium]